ncbi:hypothetical protein [Marinobacter sp.]|uniref:hypothetical protein n=1 Tax=Marinobacter sp. TaxID=50741 RepID=UPI00257FCF9E|nr:hypothetical protein [Marinobacter sp.]|tara:strand:+ start:751 stop:966 length:216 start_codon:yes stop_codon:yes gene_type:complete
MHKIDKNYNATMASKNVHGVVGENSIWDGPLDQNGRPHGVGSSSGITGMQVLKAKSYYTGQPITKTAKVYK